MGTRQFAVLAWLGLAGCREPIVSVEPTEQRTTRPLPVLDGDDEALLESLLADDPSDFHVARARIWRIGSARWFADRPMLGRSPPGPRGAGLDQPLEVVVIDAEGGRILLPLDDLDRGSGAPDWPAVRLVAHLEPGDLVAGLTRELHPTAWLSVAAGVWLTPRDRDNDQLRVSWSDPACGFGLELAIDAADFGPFYEPGPSGRPSDEPDPSAASIQLEPGTQLYADVDGREPIVRLAADRPSESNRVSVSQQITLLGKPARNKLQAIELRCHGVLVKGFVPPASLTEAPGWFAVVESTVPPSSSCGGFDNDPILVARGTPLFEPNTSELVGVVAADVELGARPIPDGWWQACVPSPWGDLIVDFAPR